MTTSKTLFNKNFCMMVKFKAYIQILDFFVILRKSFSDHQNRGKQTNSSQNDENEHKKLFRTYNISLKTRDIVKWSRFLQLKKS